MTRQKLVQFATAAALLTQPACRGEDTAAPRDVGTRLTPKRTAEQKAPPSEKDDRETGPNLSQGSSYFVRDLPFGWRVVSLDAQGGAIDQRQRTFLEGVVKLPHPDGCGMNERRRVPHLLVGR